MTAYLITIGDELLIGQTIDTNSAFMGKALNEIGVWVKRKIAIGDLPNEIISALDDALPQADVILITGGLGPTKDDLTKHVLCNYFKGNLVIDEKVLEFVTGFFTKRNLPMLEVNKAQALVPDNCEVLYNAVGTAPGMLWHQQNKIIVSMPGVPHEMEYLMQTYVLPLLKEQSKTKVEHRTLITAGIGESFLAEKVKAVESALPLGIKLAYLPSSGMVKLRLTAQGTPTEIDKLNLAEHFKLLQQATAEHLMATEDLALEEIIGKKLLEQNATLALAESCTGGYIASKITSVAGCSQYFNGGAVVYSYDAKETLLNVNRQTIEKHGAVSEQVVNEMCNGALQKFNATYAIAVSGIAGPSGGTAEKPVGTVCIAVGTKNKTTTQTYHFGRDRKRNIEWSYVMAMIMLNKLMTET